MQKGGEQRMRNKVLFEVEFDSDVWISLSDSQKQQWIDDVASSINEQAYVSDLTIKEEKEEK
jgi:hypothetical protein